MRIFILLILAITSCTQLPQPTPSAPPIIVVSPSPTPVPTPVPAPVSQPTVAPAPQHIVLAWEANHPERAAWSDSLEGLIRADISVYSTASDITKICPKYSVLDDETKVHVISELWVADAYYESSWDPNSQSVDVGTKSDKNTWSIGLLQMSVVDQDNYGFNFGYGFDDLLKPYENMRLADAIMALQIKKHGVIMIPVGMSGLYWASMHPGGKYDSSAQIIARVQKNVPACN